jgi:hypothetical protein
MSLMKGLVASSIIVVVSVLQAQAQETHTVIFDNRSGMSVHAGRDILISVVLYFPLDVALEWCAMDAFQHLIVDV